MKNKFKILIVEDEKKLRETLINILSENYETNNADSVKQAKQIINKERPDLILLDIVLADEDEANGLQLCKWVKKQDEKLPIIMLTGKTALNYKLGAFKFGADDYICKPFNLLELKARIEALLKRYDINNKLKVGDIELFKDTYTVKKAGKCVDLRKKEFEILKLLMQNKGKVLTRNVIISSLWGIKDISSNTIDVHIVKLRSMLEGKDNGFKIKTIYGMGYKLE